MSTPLDYGGPHDNFRDAAAAMKDSYEAYCLDTQADGAEVGLRLSWETFQKMADEYTEMEEERDRARRLAVKLEEVVAMRSAVLRALVEWADAPAPPRTIANRLDPIGPKAVVDWARAQLAVIP